MSDSCFDFFYPSVICRHIWVDTWNPCSPTNLSMSVFIPESSYVMYSMVLFSSFHEVYQLRHRLVTTYLKDQEYDKARIISL